MDTKLVEMKGRADKLIRDAEEVFTNQAATADQRNEARGWLKEATDLMTDADSLLQAKQFMGGIVQGLPQHDPAMPATPTKFKSLGEGLQAIYAQTFKGRADPRLKSFIDPTEPNTNGTTSTGWAESKDLVESIGASGGFLVPTEQREELMLWPAPANDVRQRATVIPMRRRAIQIPTLDQTGTTAGQPHWYGGVLAKWTEEAGYKEETEPKFRQIELVAHKLVTYTEASDELLADSAISLESLLSQFFAGAINWFEEDAFINGTGAGQPRGVIGAGATITVAPAVAGALNVADFANMLEAFQGVNPIWMINRQWMSNLIQLNGPAANPSYVFIPNAREGVPSMLFGYPVIWSEHMPLPGVAGSVLLADWSKYLIGDRQATTVDASKHYRFRYDLTAWRATHRVDGQPWLSVPLTYSDGTTQVSPFVILGAGAAS